MRLSEDRRLTWCVSDDLCPWCPCLIVPSDQTIVHGHLPPPPYVPMTAELVHPDKLAQERIRLANLLHYPVGVHPIQAQLIVLVTRSRTSFPRARTDGPRSMAHDRSGPIGRGTGEVELDDQGEEDRHADHQQELSPGQWRRGQAGESRVNHREQGGDAEIAFRKLRPSSCSRLWSRSRLTSNE
jgi:hypothetical protein